MKFRRWVDSIGQSTLARRLGVSRSTVFRWHAGERTPDDRFKMALIKMSKNKITFKDIMEVKNGPVSNR